jgi:hypothetical protein
MGMSLSPPFGQLMRLQRVSTFRILDHIHYKFAKKSINVNLMNKDAA